MAQADTALTTQASTACFRCDREVCPYCYKRPGLIFGTRGFGVRQRGCERRCRERTDINIEPPAPERERFDSAASRPSGALGRPSATPTSYYTCRESDPEAAALIQEKAEAALKAEADRKAAENALEEAAAALADSTSGISSSTEKLVPGSGRDSGASKPEQARTCRDSASTAASKPDEVSNYVFTPSSTEVSHNAKDSDFGLSDQQIQRLLQEHNQASIGKTSIIVEPQQAADGIRERLRCSLNSALDSGLLDEALHLLQTSPDACRRLEAELAGHLPEVSSVEKVMVKEQCEALASEEDKAEAKMLSKVIFELCDTDGLTLIPLTGLVEMCLNHRYVAEFLGVNSSSADVACEQMTKVIGHDGQISYAEFEKLVCPKPRRAGVFPRLSEEQQIDLIFESCDVLKRGEISLVEFTAFCVKRPNVAAAVGMKKEMLADGKRRKRVGTDDIFARIDTDGSGKVSRQELRAFVWKQRARASDDAKADLQDGDEKAPKNIEASRVPASTSAVDEPGVASVTTRSIASSTTSFEPKEPSQTEDSKAKKKKSRGRKQ